MTSKETARENAELLDVNTQLLLRLERANIKIEELQDRITNLKWEMNRLNVGIDD